jgi:ribosomal-protein-alanine N-acetyltransferase
VTVYHGPPIAGGPVSVVEPDEPAQAAALEAADLSDHQKAWFARAASDEAIYYFAIEYDALLVGQVVLHDIDWAAAEALVGYHIFRPEDRGLGCASAALGAVRSHAFGQLGLRRLVAITTYDNAASRRTAARAGFRETGPAREGPHLVGYELIAPTPA